MAPPPPPPWTSVLPGDKGDICKCEMLPKRLPPHLPFALQRLLIFLRDVARTAQWGVWHPLRSGGRYVPVVFGDVCVVSFHLHDKVQPVFFVFPAVFAKYSIPIRTATVVPGLISRLEFFCLILSSFPSSSINIRGCCWLIEMDF